MDFCDVINKLRAWYFPKDRDVYLQANRSFYLGDGTQITASCFVPIGGIIGWSGAIVDIPTNFALCDGSGGTPDLRGSFIVGAGGAYNVGDTGGADTVDLAHSHDVSGSTGSESSHTHGPGTLATDSDAHTHGPGTLNTDSDTHSHGPGSFTPTAIQSSSGDVDQNLDGSTVIAAFTHTHIISGLTANDSHDHDVDAGATASDSHSHDVDAGATAAGSAHSHSAGTLTTDSQLSATTENRPVYYALAFIMRLA